MTEQHPPLGLDRGGRALLRAIVSGPVRGTGYRAFCVRHARLFGLTGCVSQRAGGSISVTAEGDMAGLEAFAAALRRGNRLSAVDRVALEWAAPTGGCEAFTMLD